MRRIAFAVVLILLEGCAAVGTPSEAHPTRPEGARQVALTLPGPSAPITDANGFPLDPTSGYPLRPAKNGAGRVPTAVSAPYTPTGVYLDYARIGHIDTSPIVKFDANGIIMVRRPDGSYVYNPTTISQYGLQQYSFFIANGTAASLDTAVLQANWLVTNQDPSTGEWLYHFDLAALSNPTLLLKAPWGSALAQGQAISLLTRVNSQRPDPKWLTAATAALTSLGMTVQNGGLQADFFGSGHPWYEEYPTTPSLYTLNGFMFCLFGLYDMSVASPGSSAGVLYAQGRTTLDYGLPFFDTGAVSSYHLGHITFGPRPITNSLNYHHIHITELNALNSIGADNVVAYYASTWATYVAPLTIATTALPGAQTGVAYSASLVAVGGTPPYVWSVARGQLPSGLVLSTKGIISGTPTASGGSAFTVLATDVSNPVRAAVRAMTITTG